jgi:hypothetical protein
MIRVASAGTEMVDAIGNAVPPRDAAEYTLIEMSAAVVPSTFAATIELILKTFPLEAALLTKEVAEVVVRDTLEVLP